MTSNQRRTQALAMSDQRTAKAQLRELELYLCAPTETSVKLAHELVLKMIGAAVETTPPTAKTHALARAGRETPNGNAGESPAPIYSECEHQWGHHGSGGPCRRCADEKSAHGISGSHAAEGIADDRDAFGGEND